MCMVICGDFEPEVILGEVKKRLIKKDTQGEIKRIYEEEEDSIVKKKVEAKMDVSIPLYTIGIKCTPKGQKEKVKNHIAVDILLNMIIGESSRLYQELYKEGIILNMPSFEYEFTDDYAHILISGASRNPEIFYERLKQTIEEMKNNGLDEKDFARIKKMIYGEYVKEYNGVQDIARMFLSDFMKGINSFDYFEEIERVDLKYAKQVLDTEFNKDKMVFSVVKEN